jgi:ribonuclease HII
MILGIDEAGKGCIVGPLVIGAVLCKDQDVFSLLIKDSKMLNAKQRNDAYFFIEEAVEAFEAVEVSIAEIDKAVVINGFNWLEADHIVKLIDKYKPRICYIDCPHPRTNVFKEYIFERIKHKECNVVCAHKADSKYPVVSAASIVAKVTRDAKVDEIRERVGIDFGSGYLGDPKTKEFLSKHWEKHGDILRKSWKTYKNLVAAKSQTSLGQFE